MDSDTENTCSICNKQFDEGQNTTTVKIIGLNTLIQTSQEKNDDKWKLWEGKLSIKVHTQCQKNYIKKRSSDVALDRPRKKKRSLEGDTQPSSSSSRNVSMEACYESGVDSPSLLAAYDIFAFNYEESCIICIKKLDRRNKEVIKYSGKAVKEILISYMQNRESDHKQFVIDFRVIKFFK